MNGNAPNPGLELHWKNTYSTWNSVWSKAFLELDGRKNLSSDEFTRQPHVLTLMDDADCLMSVFFREVDMSLPASLDDSYFQGVWPDKNIEELQKYSNKVCVCSYTTVAPLARGIFHGISMKHLLMAFACEFARNGDCSAVTATTRNNRGMDKAVRNAGARLLNKGLVRHGVEVDLMGWFGSELQNFSHEYQGLVNKLWNNRWDHRYSKTWRPLRIADKAA